MADFELSVSDREPNDYRSKFSRILQSVQLMEEGLTSFGTSR